MIKSNLEINGKTLLVTGAAGFIGANFILKIISCFKNVNIIGIDNLNDYYDTSLKEYRLKKIESKINIENTGCKWMFYKENIADKVRLQQIFFTHKPQIVVNLAAQAGVRYSIINPDVYIESNIIGFYNVLELCRHSYEIYESGVEHLIYASSSSVYGSNAKIPYSTVDKVDEPVSLYAATKKSNELLAHSYSKIYNIPSTGLRFFTVYGPAGRPDMAYFGFTNDLCKNKKIQIYNYGNCKRDFTYIEDVVDAMIKIIQRAPEKKNGEDGLPLPPYKIYNIGNNKPESLLDFVNILQEELVLIGVLDKEYDFDEHKELVPMQAGDVVVTYAEISELQKDFDFKPKTSLRDGLYNFVKWYKKFYIDKSN